jgi:hypothetical protein
MSAFSCLCSSLTTGCSPFQGVVRIVRRIYSFQINSDLEQVTGPNPSKEEEDDDDGHFGQRRYF